MEAKTITNTTTAVEITKEQFNQLTADMIPSSANEVRQMAREILMQNFNPNSKVGENAQEAIKSLDHCRRFLNTQYMLREMMNAFNPPETCKKR